MWTFFFSLGELLVVAMDEALADGALFLLKTYPLYVAIAYLHRHVGLGLAALCAVPAVQLAAKDRAVRAVLAPPEQLLDVAFLYILVPCLCLPAVLLNGFGGGALVFLYALFCWRRNGTSSFISVLLLLPVYSLASALGCFEPRISLSEGTVLAATSAVSCAMPPRILAAILPVMLAISPNARALLSECAPVVAAGGSSALAAAAATAQAGASASFSAAGLVISGAAAAVPVALSVGSSLASASQRLTSETLAPCAAWVADAAVDAALKVARLVRGAFLRFVESAIDALNSTASADCDEPAQTPSLQGSLVRAGSLLGLRGWV